MQHDIEKLAREIDSLHESLEMFSAGWEDLIKIIHMPGWTTLPEYKLVWAVVSGMNAHVKAMNDQKKILWESASEISSQGGMAAESEVKSDPMPA